MFPKSVATAASAKGDPKYMRYCVAKGFLVLIPVLAMAFSGCDTTGSSAPAGDGSGTGAAAGAGTGSRDVPEGESRTALNSPSMTTQSAALEATAIPSGIARIHGKFYQLRDGKATLLDQKERFAEGVEFEPTGRITLKDGTIVKLREHEMVTFSGERRDVPLNISMPKALPPGSAGSRN